ncbi:PDDEXK nuclease domain-containing protein [Paeniglutamicibacter cryotolerans]|uniref:Putative nuclease of restriction endonuclease-like (RecB) superfamily n=1 Tax=Paeniglutamicibacter cryotolerans TaxID=670079 RepID=A0A839QIQ8_9MICC|nr:PDDEXK nuclease domain-containing protein [Paeniglutamicibacter cryotolerans]MBB2995677.1 putative nuclease of restriction endonuclease-like (RecB) superfamily [Paeniglutamicibacter cryotolerans]
MTQLEPELPGDYSDALTTLKTLVREAQHRAQRVVNTAMIELYWNIGRTILERQIDQPWGSKVMDRVAQDLRTEFPHMKGFSRTNVYNMRAFATAWSGEEPIVQTPSGQLSWSHNVALLNKLDNQELRRWYASRAVQHGWSVAVLEHQIRTSLHTRAGAAPNNLEVRLPGEGTDLAREVAKDPLVLDFLGLTEDAQEHAMEEAMTLRMAQTLAEFGEGFAFVGRQYHLDVDGDSFFVDLLLYHVPSDRYVVVELKAGKFKPAHLGQLNFYVAAINDMLRLPRQAPTVGILVCGSKSERTVRYALDGSTQPLAVTSYTYEALPVDEKATLPSPDAIMAALEHDPGDDPEA